jgi:hypothetical protein
MDDCHFSHIKKLEGKKKKQSTGRQCFLGASFHHPVTKKHPVLLLQRKKRQMVKEKHSETVIFRQ